MERICKLLEEGQLFDAFDELEELELFMREGDEYWLTRAKIFLQFGDS